MTRNIFNQPPRNETESGAHSPTPLKAAKLPESVGGLRDSLREITANSIHDIEPDQIDMDGLRDRLVLEHSGIDELAESIRKHSQQVPIMFRPSAQPDRYRIIYGRRRLAAIRKIGGTVKAIVRTLDDDASLIAQGQENNLRPELLNKIPLDQDIGNVTADGAYDTRKCHEAIAARDAHAVIPLRKNAKSWKPTSAGAIAR